MSIQTNTSESAPGEHQEREKQKIEELRPESVEKLFDVLAAHDLATVKIEFMAGSSYGSTEYEGSIEAMNTEGEEIDLEQDLPGLGCAVHEFIHDTWKEYASEVDAAWPARSRYDDDGIYFDGGSGTVTFDITDRTVSVVLSHVVKSWRIPLHELPAATNVSWMPRLMSWLFRRRSGK